MSALRERRDDFATAAHALDGGVSLERRPDALSWDYRTAFAPGPRAVGDPSAGLLSRAWRAVAEDGTVRLARAGDAGNAWEAETVLFAYAGAPLEELGLAFDQNGRVVVCAERATGTGGAAEVWLYRYDPGAAAYLLSALGPGRTPRVLLDEPHATADSDVLLFYVSDAADAVMYRQQRDHYAAEHATPLQGSSELRLEGVGWDREGRVRVVAARRDGGTGIWALEQAASTLYPLRTDGAEDPLGIASRVRSIEVRQTVLTPPSAPEGGAMRHALLGVVVADPTIRYVSEADAQAAPVHALQGLAVRALVVGVDARDPADGGHRPAHTLRGLQVQAVVLTHQPPADTGAHLPGHTLGGIQVKPLIDELSPAVEPDRAQPAHTLSSIDVVALVRQEIHAGDPTLPENQHVPTHALRSIAVGP